MDSNSDDGDTAINNVKIIILSFIYYVFRITQITHRIISIITLMVLGNNNNLITHPTII